MKLKLFRAAIDIFASIPIHGRHRFLQQPDGKYAALTRLRLNADFAAILPYKAVADGESEACAMAYAHM
jgi:hypothetical protein